MPTTVSTSLVHITLTLDEAQALRAAVDALVTQDRELPAGDREWRVTRMVAALTGRIAIEDSIEAVREAVAS